MGSIWRFFAHIADPEVVALHGDLGVRAADQIVLIGIEGNLAARVASDGDVGKFADRQLLRGSGLA